MTTTSDATNDVFVFPASYAQGRLWFLYQLDRESAAYNIDVALRLFGALTLDALEAACAALVTRHEALRTTFAQEGDDPVQVVHPAPESRYPVELIDLQGEPADRREELL